MEEFEGNSNKSKNEVVSTEKPSTDDTVKVITSKKKSKIEKNLGDLKNYAIYDVFLPGIKGFLSDIVRNGIDMLLYGRRGASVGSRYNSPYRTTNVPYTDYSYRRDYRRSSYRDDYRDDDFDDCELRIQPHSSNNKALEVLDKMRYEIEKNKICTVLSYYDFCEKGSIGRASDERFGWTNLDNVVALPCRGGFYLDLPRPMPIDF